MKNLGRIVLLTILLLIENWFSPFWWSVLVIPFLFMTLTVKKSYTGFGNSFVAGLLVWGGVAFYKYCTGSYLIANRMADVFQLPGGGIVTLVVVGLFGALLAGLGGMTGASLRAILKPERKNIYY